jgi:hypothetical protein
MDHRFALRAALAAVLLLVASGAAAGTVDF